MKGSCPEDFMDEEDLAELREGQKLVENNDEMDLFGGTQVELRQKGGSDEPEEYVCYTFDLFEFVC
jgi:G patch domain-containing protein 1